MDTHDEVPGPKQTVVRGARACTVCRAAKMKCVPSTEGGSQCQRCKRSNSECIFEKHRRGRKPGSKLSEASKMLRRLEKGLNRDKLKSGETMGNGEYQLGNARFDPGTAQQGISDRHYAASTGSRSMTLEDPDESNVEKLENDSLYPARMISKEKNERNSFFRTILNPEDQDSPNSTSSSNGNLERPRQARNHGSPSPMNGAPMSRAVTGYRALDPISANIITAAEAKNLFDMLFLRLNPFINLFDPVLHTVDYVRNKCNFLFTTMIMAACKFFKADLFQVCQTMANELAVRAFAEGWKSVEVAQAFACLTYWKDPDDKRTWTYIGYACRMAIELNLNRTYYSPSQLQNETALSHLERRNRERTYLILFVHDRSLSTQTGRLPSVPEDSFIRRCTEWHRDVFLGVNSGENGAPQRARPEDVIVVAFVQLRRIASSTTDMFNAGSQPGELANEISHDAILRNCNSKLDHWEQTWHQEMEHAQGDSFHFHFLDFFQLYSRLFINSFGIRAAVAPSSHSSPNLDALSACCTSGLSALKIISIDFAKMNMLRYGQDSILVMSAYCSVFLLRLLRSTNIVSLLQPGIALEIHNVITKTADAYHEASQVLTASPSATYHARFLRALVVKDVFPTRGNGMVDEKPYGATPIDPRLQDSSGHSPVSSLMDRHHGYSNNSNQYGSHTNIHGSHHFNFPASPHLPGFPLPTYMPESAERTTGTGSGMGPGHNAMSYSPHSTQMMTRMDQQYWNTMFVEELGFGGPSPPHNMPNVHHNQQQYHGGMQDPHRA